MKALNQTPLGKANGGKIVSLHERSAQEGASQLGMTLDVFSERSLLMSLLEKIQESDPDAIVGHAITDIDLCLLLQRLQHTKAIQTLHRKTPDQTVRV